MIVDKYTLLESYLEEVRVRKVPKLAAQKLESSGRAMIDSFITKFGKFIMNPKDAKKIKLMVDRIPMYGTVTIFVVIAAFIARRYYKYSYGQFADGCKSIAPSPENMKLCILKARIKSKEEAIKLLQYAQKQCSKTDDSSKCKNKFELRIKKELEHIRTIQGHMTGKL